MIFNLDGPCTQEIFDHHNVRKLGLGGKKAMVGGHRESSSEMESSKSDEKGAANSKISGATYSDGKSSSCDFDEKERGINEKCKSRATRKFKMMMMGGFVAFTDDYHGPSHHISEHN